MSLEITFSKASEKKSEAAVVCFYEDIEQGKSAKALDYTLSGYVEYALGKSNKFKGKNGQSEIVMLPEDAPYDYAVLLGLGERDKTTMGDIEAAGGKLCLALEAQGIVSAEIYMDDEPESAAETAAHLALGIKMRAYRFERYKAAPDKEEDKPKRLKSVNVAISTNKETQTLYETQSCVAEGVFWARDLVNEPPNVLYPDAYARRIKEELKPLGVEVTVFDEKKMLKLGLGALMAVGQGSDQPPRMVMMRWKGASDSEGPVALVGKGVTFDTGGISLKPGANMDEMKMDMGGSAAVVGAMKALALRKAKADVIGIVGLVENMPSARAYRPGDIITAYSGKTIEVLNTDAEGRLVLADCLSYVQEQYKPRMIVDLATLTGAMLIALGHEYAGTFATHDDLWEEINAASVQTNDRVWRMPLDEVWKKDMESDVADVQNLAKSGRSAGSCTAAGFLWHFIEDETPWAHMDIAGTAWIKSDKPLTPKFGTGYGVRLLDRLIADNYEQ